MEGNAAPSLACHPLQHSLRAEVLNKESERDVWSQDMVADTDAVEQIGPAVLASGTDEYGVSKVLPS